MLALLASALLGLAPAAGAGERNPPDLRPIDAAPPPPPRIRSGEIIDPDVTIRESSEGRITEYRLGDRLIAIKVQPKHAPAYYLVDSDGDGVIEDQRHPLQDDFLINAWVIFRW